MLEKEVLLLDDYGQDSQMLHESLVSAGFCGKVLVIRDDGFLPNGVESVYRTLIKKCRGMARYFNGIDIPDYWRIEGDGRNAKVFDMQYERARIFYADPSYRRLVKVVDWLDDKGKVRFSDHYDRHGQLYARTVFNKDSKLISKSYFDGDGREILVENYVTQDILFNDKEGHVHVFHSKIDYILFVLEKLNLSKARLFINSLSTPFFVSQRMDRTVSKDVLFWQEPLRDDVPGNMQIILSKQSRVKDIFVQRKESLDQLLKLTDGNSILKPLGFIYDFKKENTYGNQMLICTNSDQIEKCRELVEGLPEMHFHIAALTEMSTKLLDMGRYDNVSLYPAIKLDVLDRLFMDCDWYLDINHGPEIVTSVKKAFLHNHIIFGFKNTLHNARYILDTNIFESAQHQKMIDTIQKISHDKQLMMNYVEKQRGRSLSENKESYSVLWDQK